MFQPILADARDYPAARVPILPRRLMLRIGRTDNVSPFLNAPATFERGCYALAEAMRRCKVGAGTGDVLMPAFHCRIMVEAANHLGVQPVFYPVGADLSPDPVALERLVVGRTVRAMILVHYFGFPNTLNAAASFCDRHGVALIEDCAHALYGHVAGQPLGTTGRCATASLWKFLSVPDGGVLVDRSASSPPKSAGRVDTRRQLRGIVDALRPRPLPPTPLPPNQDDCNRAVERARQRAAQGSTIETPQGAREFRAAHAHRGPLAWSRLVASLSDHAKIIERRRARYRFWVAALADVPGVRPLHPVLPDGVVPYAFPLLTDESGFAFHALRMAGIPMWRWEDMAPTDCAVARRYRVALLQLPCHQDLTDNQMQWMVNTARHVLIESRLPASAP